MTETKYIAFQGEWKHDNQKLKEGVLYEFEEYIYFYDTLLDCATANSITKDTKIARVEASYDISDAYIFLTGKASRRIKIIEKITV